MIQHFLDYIAIERKYSPRTVEAYRDDLRDFCRFLGVDPANYDPEKVDEEDVKTWMRYLLEQEHQAPRSVKRRLSALHSFYRFLLRQKRVKRDVTARVLAPKADKPLPVFVRPTERERVTEQDKWADTFEAIRDSLIIEMLYKTWMRQAGAPKLTDKSIYKNKG